MHYDGSASGQIIYTYVNGNPLSYTDPYGLTAAGAAIGQRIGSYGGAAAGELIGPEGIPIGWALGGAIGNAIGDAVSNAMSSDTPHSRDEYDDQNIERIANQREYQNNCDNQNPPPGLDPCETAKWKLKHVQMCIDSRRAYTNRWHDGVDEKHDSQLYRDLERRRQNAENEVARVCKCPK